MARKRKPKNTDAPGLLFRLGQWLKTDPAVRFQKKLVLLFLMSLLLGSVVFGFALLEKYVQNITRQRQVSLTVSLKNPPRWAGEELIEQICLFSGVRSDDFILDKDLTAQWADNLARHPWIKQVNLVRKQYNGAVEIDCRFRQPIASLRKNQETYYLDPEGVVLPAAPVSCRLIRLEGTAASIPEPGQTVKNPDLLAGLEILAKILQMDEQLPRPERLWNELAVLDVSNYEGRLSSARPHLVLFTNNMTEIYWGAAIGRSLPYNEADFKYKLSTLYRTFKKSGSLDADQHVDLRDRRRESPAPLRSRG